MAKDIERHIRADRRSSHGRLGFITHFKEYTLRGWTTWVFLLMNFSLK